VFSCSGVFMVMLNRKSTKLIIVSVVIVLLLFFLHYIKVLRPIENLAVSATKPVLRSVYQISYWVGDNYLNFRSKQALVQENKDLKDQLAMLINEKSRCVSEQEENQFLREQMQFVDKNQYLFEIARVIGQSADGSQNALILDVGSKVGIEVGQPVLAEQNMLIGKIIKVNKNSSIVLLINDDLSKVAARIQNKSRTIGVVEGEFGLGIKMRLIPQTEMIKEGDIIVTSGLEQKVPGNIVIGQIKSIVNEPEELFQEAALASMVDFNKINIVNILKYNQDDD